MSGLDALKRRSVMQLAAIEICEQYGNHLFNPDYYSHADIGRGFPFRPGDSAVCVRCGKRVTRSEASREGIIYGYPHLTGEASDLRRQGK